MSGHPSSNAIKQARETLTARNACSARRGVYESSRITYNQTDKRHIMGRPPAWLVGGRIAAKERTAPASFASRSVGVHVMRVRLQAGP